MSSYNLRLRLVGRLYSQSRYSRTRAGVVSRYSFAYNALTEILNWTLKMHSLDICVMWIVGCRPNIQSTWTFSSSVLNLYTLICGLLSNFYILLLTSESLGLQRCFHRWSVSTAWISLWVAILATSMHHPVFGIIFLPHSANLRLPHHLKQTSHHPSLPLSSIPDLKRTCSTNPSHHRWMNEWMNDVFINVW